MRVERLASIQFEGSGQMFKPARAFNFLTITRQIRPTLATLTNTELGLRPLAIRLVGWKHAGPAHLFTTWEDTNK